MLWRKLQAEAAGIELCETRAKRNEQIALLKDFLHRAKTGDAAQRKRMIAGKHSLSAGGGKDRALQKFGKLADSGSTITNAGSNKNCWRAATGNLSASVFYLLSRKELDAKWNSAARVLTNPRLRARERNRVVSQ